MKGFAKDGIERTRVATIWDRAERAAAQRKRKQKGWMIQRAYAFNRLLVFQLYRGQSIFPQTKIMTLRQCAEENRTKALAFASRLDTQPNTQLWSWRIRDKVFFEKDRKDFYAHHLGLPHETGKHILSILIEEMNEKQFGVTSNV